MATAADAKRKRGEDTVFWQIHRDDSATKLFEIGLRVALELDSKNPRSIFPSSDGREIT